MMNREKDMLLEIERIARIIAFGQIREDEMPTFRLILQSALQELSKARNYESQKREVRRAKR